MLVLLTYIGGFLVLSGLLALVDAAVLSVSQAETEELVEEGRRGARWLKQAKDQITRSVVVIVMVTNTVNVLGPILVGQKAVEIYDSTVIGIITAVLTFGTILFSEIIPKSLGAHYAPLVSRYAAPGIVILGWILFPVVVLLEWIAGLFQRGERKIGTEAQIRSLVKIGLKTGQIEQDEGQLIHRAFVLNDRSAKDLMTRSERIVGIPAAASISQAGEIAMEHQHSRFPLVGDSTHQIDGMVLGREVLSALVAGRGEAPVEELRHAMPRVASSQRSDVLLDMFRDRQVHMATVEDAEHVIGLVTLEDVLEELVGEIEDEKDLRPKAGLNRTPAGSE